MRKIAPDFKQKYGPWAVIAGASDGTGRAFTHRAAAAGINCVIIARREKVLEELAQEIRSRYDAECVPARIDLSTSDAFDKTVEAVGSREVGLLISNAGSDPNGSHFLNKDIQPWMDLVNRNVVNNMRLVHHFGSLMRQRRSGGLLLVGSAAGYGGGRFMAVYSATKAFVWCLAESLWSELRPHNVDVLYIASLAPSDDGSLMAEISIPGNALWSSVPSFAANGLQTMCKGGGMANATITARLG